MNTGDEVKNSALDLAIGKDGNIEDHVPSDGIYFYYLDNGVLHYTMEETTTEVSVVIGDRAVTLCGTNNQPDFVLNKTINANSKGKWRKKVTGRS